ncbi:hypothetical protein B0H13DRAFT_1937138 [Mycena leptocephala]|nr:hypothetical protein B0H13DRAFT_1937138 [Mycena leptocephala]
MSTKKFVVYSPGHTIQVYKLPVDISVASALGQIAPLFGNLANKSVLYKPEGLKWHSNSDTFQQRVGRWWSTAPTKLPELFFLSAYFKPSDVEPGGNDTEVDLVVFFNVEVSTTQHRRTISLSGIIPRTELVSYIYDAAKAQKILHIRGTPGSGKTVLSKLLFNHIVSQLQGDLVTLLGLWSRPRDGNATIAEALARAKQHGDSVDLEKHNTHHHWLIFDEAQSTYSDASLWSTLFKDPPDGFLFVLFAFHGSQGGGQDPDKEGTPNNILPHQQIGLRPSRNGLLDSQNIPGLYFTLDEYQIFMAEQRKKPDLPVLAEDLVKWLYISSKGHIGAIDSVLFAICTAAKAQHARASTMSLDSFLGNFENPLELMTTCTRGHAFNRGLPHQFMLSAEANVLPVRFLRRLLQFGPQNFDQVLSEDAQLAHKRGWVMAEEHGGVMTVDFPSFLHESHISLLLNGLKDLPPSLAAMTLREFILSVLCNFSRDALQAPQRHTTGPRAAPSIPEEFYRSAYKTIDGCGIWLSPEFGASRSSSAVNCIDFYVLGSMGWGIEVLREGDCIPEHLNRFEPGGASHAWIKNKFFSEYAILHFRSRTTTRKQYPNHRNLYHVSFSDDLREFEVHDCMLERVGGGKLLA